MNSLSIVNNADMSLEVELSGCLKYAIRVRTWMTDSFVNSFDVLNQFSSPFALVVALITVMNYSQMFRLIMYI